MIEDVDERAALRRFGDTAILWAAGDASALDVVDAACDALVAGADGIALATVAAISPRHADVDLPDHLDAALAEHGLRRVEPATDRGLLDAFAVLARQVADGDREPDTLTAWMFTSWWVLDGWAPASELVGLAREAEFARDTAFASAAPPGDLDDRVRAAAQRFTAGPGARST